MQSDPLADTWIGWSAGFLRFILYCSLCSTPWGKFILGYSGLRRCLRFATHFPPVWNASRMVRSRVDVVESFVSQLTERVPPPSWSPRYFFLFTGDLLLLPQSGTNLVEMGFFFTNTGGRNRFAEGLFWLQLQSSEVFVFPLPDNVPLTPRLFSFLENPSGGGDLGSAPLTPACSPVSPPADPCPNPFDDLCEILLLKVRKPPRLFLSGDR